MKHILFFVVVLFLISGAVLFAEERTWVDRTGSFQVEAMLLDFDGKQVKLKKKEDGKVISMALEKLSLPDQVYVKKMMESLNGNEEPKPVDKAADSAAKKDDSSSKRKSKPAAKEDTEEEDEESSPENANGAFKGKIPQTRISTARQIRVDLTKTSWSVPPDASKVKEIDFRIQPLDFPLGKRDSSLSVEIEGVAFADDAPEKVLTAAAAFSNFRREQKTTTVFFGDMKSLQIQSQSWPVGIHVLGLSPDGTKGLFLQETPEGRQREQKIHLTIADMTQPKLPCTGVLIPFAEFQNDRDYNAETEISWADWIDNEHILVQSKEGRIVMMEAKTGVAVWTLKASNSSVALSPGKKYLIARCQDQGTVYVLLETQTGKPIGRLSLDKEDKRRFSGFVSHFAFSPDGTQIAGTKDGMIYLWDAANGKPKEPFYIGQRIIITKNMLWVDNTHLLAHDVLVETRQQLPIWKYTGMNSNDTFFAGKYWYVESPGSRDTSFGILSVNVPHESMPRLPVLTDERKYCIRPGISVKLNVTSSVPDSEKVREYARNLLRNNGITISDQASITLNIDAKAEETKEIYYGERFGRNITGHANYTPHLLSYQFVQDGKVLWQTSSHNSAPGQISNEDLQNRSLQDVVNEKGKLTSGWFLTVEIPKKIPFDKAGTSPILSVSGRKR